MESSFPSPEKSLLLVSQDEKSCTEIPALLRACTPPIASEVARAVEDAVRRISGRTYDAVVCTVDRENEIEVVALLRQVRPDVPILLLTPSGDRELRRRCTECGADGILGRGPGGRIRPELLCRSLSAVEAARANVREVQRIYAAAAEIRELSRKRKEIVTRSGGLMRSVLGPVLLVSEDGEESEALSQALRKAGFAGEIRASATVGDALDVLSGVKEGPGAGGWGMVPSLILFDAGLLPEAGYEALRRIKQDRTLRQIPIVVLASIEDSISSAAALGINSCLLKPKDPAQMEILAQALRLYWLSLNTQTGL